MVRNNYDLIPEIRCRDCGWYSLEDEICEFWVRTHNPNGFCDEGVGKCCRNCSGSVLIEGFDNMLHRCVKKEKIVSPMYVCEDWYRWVCEDGNKGTD